VRFTYEDVPSQATTATRDRYYDSGAGQTSLSKRLIRVDTSVDGIYPDPGTTAKSYLLSYISSQQTTRSLLQSITECGADGVCLPATQFEWAQKDWNTTGHNFAVSTVSLPFGVSPFSPSKNGVYVAELISPAVVRNFVASRRWRRSRLRLRSRLVGRGVSFFSPYAMEGLEDLQPSKPPTSAAPA